MIWHHGFTQSHGFILLYPSADFLRAYDRTVLNMSQGHFRPFVISIAIQIPEAASQTAYNCTARILLAYPFTLRASIWERSGWYVEFWPQTGVAPVNWT
jgi:hypothetical protein